MLLHHPQPGAREDVEAPARSRVPSILGHSPVWFGLAFLVLAARIALGPSLPQPLGELMGATGIILFAASALVAMAQGFAAIRCGNYLETLGQLMLAGFSALGMLIAYIATVGFSRGRQLRRFGRVVLPRL